MPKLNLTDTTSLVGIFTPLNANFDAIETEFDKVLYRDGTSPNEMNTNLDMNSYRIYNLPAANSPDQPVRKAELDAAVIGNYVPDSADQIGFTPTGPGAVARTVDAKLKESVSVKDFGATGDGTTNDTAAFDAALATGKPVLVPPGTYLCEQISLPAGAYLFGLGDTSVIKKRSSTGHGLQVSSVDGVTIATLRLDGNTKIGGHGISATRADDLTIRGVSGTGIALTGIYVDRDGADLADFPKNVLVTECAIDDTGLAGIAVTAQGAVVSNNRSTNSGTANIGFFGTGIVVEGNYCSASGMSDNITGYDNANLDTIVANNICENSSNNGMHVGGSRLTVTGNIVRSPAFKGISIASDPNPTPTQAYDVTCANNVIWDLPGLQPGIEVRNVDRLSVSGNMIDGVAANANSHGISLNDVLHFSVVGNVITNVDVYGIVVNISSYGAVNSNEVTLAADGIYITDDGATASQGIVISGNVVQGCTRSIRLVSLATGCIVSNNVLQGNGTDHPTLPASGSYAFGNITTKYNGLRSVSETVGALVADGIDVHRFVKSGSADTYLETTALAGASLIQAKGATNASMQFRPSGTGTISLRDSTGTDHLSINTTGIGFFGASPASRQTVSGSRGGNAALASLLTALATAGLITDSTTAW